jgi:hypothetical protein
MEGSWVTPLPTFYCYISIGQFISFTNCNQRRYLREFNPEEIQNWWISLGELITINLSFFDKKDQTAWLRQSG